MKVIRSPNVFEAELFHSKGNIPKCVKSVGNQKDHHYIETNGIYVYLQDGDYILTDPDGGVERYSEEEFRKTFERIENG